MVSFPSFCSFGDNSVLFRYCPVQRPFCTFLLVSLIKNFLSFLFYFLPFFGWEFSFFSFCFLPLFDWEFPFFSFFAFSLIGNFPSFPFLLPRVRIMVSQDFGSRLVEWLDMIHVRVWFGSRIKGMPHTISMTQMQK